MNIASLSVARVTVIAACIVLRHLLRKSRVGSRQIQGKWGFSIKQTRACPESGIPGWWAQGKHSS